jgi:hypothetical protein
MAADFIRGRRPIPAGAPYENRTFNQLATFDY